MPCVYCDIIGLLSGYWRDSLCEKSWGRPSILFYVSWLLPTPLPLQATLSLPSFLLFRIKQLVFANQAGGTTTLLTPASPQPCIHASFAASSSPRPEHPHPLNLSIMTEPSFHPVLMACLHVPPPGPRPAFPASSCYDGSHHLQHAF